VLPVTVFIPIYKSDLPLRSRYARAKQSVGDGGEVCTGIAIDLQGNSVLVGNLSQTIRFESDSVTSKGGNDIFLSSFDTPGCLKWIKSAGGTENVFATSVAVCNA